MRAWFGRYVVTKENDNATDHLVELDRTKPTVLIQVKDRIPTTSGKTRIWSLTTLVATNREFEGEESK